MEKSSPLISRGVEEIIGQDELEKKLKSGKKLRVKFGIDPTSKDLHLGHLVCLHKLNEFQESGHKIIFIIGDYTARIGDPTNREKAREFLSKKQIKANMKDYIKQASFILNMKKADIIYNSKWFEKGKSDLLMELALTQTVARVIEREDFKKRMKMGQDICMQELFYPLMQGYDSVMIKSDIEIGGTDQKFNMLMGRDIQKKYGQKPQSVMTLPLLVGLDGKKKMSKSFNNYIGLMESADIQYGKTMSIPDELIADYFELAARTSGRELDKIKKVAENPKKRRDLKAALARDITAILHGSEASLLAEENFNRVFREKKQPINIPEYKIKKKKCGKLKDILVDLDLAPSKSEARRLIEQKAVKIDNALIEDPDSQICLYDGMIIKVGKMRFLKIVK